MDALPQADRSALEPDRETLASWLKAFADAAFDHLDRLPDAHASGRLGPEAAVIAESSSRPIGEEPYAGGASELASIVVRAADAALNTIGPGYLAYIPGGGLPATAIASLTADLLNRYTGLVPAAPALMRLESDVLRWLAREFGYGPAAGGLLTSGGSLSQLAAMVTARHARFGDVAVPADATAYTSTQAHRSVSKALRLAGHATTALRAVPVDERFRMDPQALDAAVRRDLDAGRLPFLVVAAAGTTNTGAVDPLPALADVCAAHGLWLHVDGAYGGAFVLCPEGRELLRGLERADSITFDPHKGMFLPYGTGALLVKDGAALRRAHQDDADYLQDLDLEQSSAASPAEYGPELSRPFRGLRLWLPLMLHGARAFREALSEKLALARVLLRRPRPAAGDRGPGRAAAEHRRVPRPAGGRRAARRLERPQRGLDGRDQRPRPREALQHHAGDTRGPGLYGARVRAQLPHPRRPHRRAAGGRSGDAPARGAGRHRAGRPLNTRLR